MQHRAGHHHGRWGGTDIPYSFAIIDADGNVVADDSHAVRTMELRIVTWRTGQCRQGSGTWDQHYWNRPADEPSEPPDALGTPIRGDRVPPGRYRVRIDSPLGEATSEPFRIES